MPAVKTSHLACFVLCLIFLSAIFTQRFILSNDGSSKYAELIDKMSDRFQMIRLKIGNVFKRGSNTTESSLSSADEPLYQHPHVSPRIGTDISPEHHDALFDCHNQSNCIVPDLQLSRIFKVYMCTKGRQGGIRFFYLVREGLLLHPNVIMVPFDDINSADLVIYLPGTFMSL
jgi:hypothetical protein